jgi:non-heme Fe2+,alpha-ketoglutarate-dependent halogenase
VDTTGLLHRAGASPASLPVLPPRSLTAAQVEQFRADGYLAPIPVLSGADALRTRSQLDALMLATGGLADPAARHKPHLYSKWVSDLVRHPRVLDAVEDVLGPDLLVWRATFFVKPAEDPHYVAWHQDSAYWGLDPSDVVTAWIALTDSSHDNGCLRVVPGSHLQPELPHGIHASADNMLVRGQSVTAPVPDSDTRDVELQPGEMSLHHVGILHGSRPNRSPRPRVGLAVRYIAAHVKQRGIRQGASVVRGSDAFGYFDHEPEPTRDNDPLAMQWHRRSQRRYTMELLLETLRRPSPSHLISAGRLLAQPSKLHKTLRSLWRRP